VSEPRDASAPAEQAATDATGPAPDAVEPATERSGPGRGMSAVAADEFSFSAAVGGPRGAVESVLPGLLFVVVFVATRELMPSLIASGGVAVLAVIVRLVQRQPPTQAFSGAIGVGIGVIWAWRTGRAEDYYAWGLLVNGAYAAAFLVSILVRWPLVGLVVGVFRPDGPLSSTGSWAGAVAWRRDRSVRSRYTWATWLWVGMFAARLAVQVPLYYAGQVGWLGTAKLVMGVPLTAVVLWLSWILVRGTTGSRPDPLPTPPGS
jgi:hypothetical protein